MFRGLRYRSLAVAARKPFGAYLPVPERATVCGEPVALSAMSSVAARAPVAAGLKVTEIVQEALAARDDPQVWVWLKSPAFVPLIEIAREPRLAVPLLVTVTLCAVAAVPDLVEANVRAVAESVTLGAAATPVPESEAVCGDPVALSAILTDAVLAPVAAGLNVTETVHFEPAASEVPQVLD